MEKYHAALGAGAIMGASVVMPGTAFGSSCGGSRLGAPNWDATDVPTNTLIWGFGAQADERLMGPEGEVPTERYFLPLALARGLGVGVAVLRPTPQLAPSTRYWREYTYEVPGGIETERIGFETGVGPALGTPALPELLSSTASVEEDGWADEGFDRFVHLEFAHDGILISDIYGALGDVASIDDLMLPQTLDADASQISASSKVVRWATTESSVTAGRGTCLQWPEVDEDRVPARFGVFDLAGNFSGWQDVNLAIPSLGEARALATEAAAMGEPVGVDAARLAAQSTSCAVTPAGMRGQTRMTVAGLALGVLFTAVRRRSTRQRIPAMCSLRRRFGGPGAAARARPLAFWQ